MMPLKTDLADAVAYNVFIVSSVQKYGSMCTEPSIIGLHVKYISMIIKYKDLDKSILEVHGNIAVRATTSKFSSAQRLLK